MARTSRNRDRILARLGEEIPRFQRVSNGVDRAASIVLALGEAELRALDAVREGPITAAMLAAQLGGSAREQDALLDRLCEAGYAQPLGDGRFETTEHARIWMEDLWGPIRDAGFALLASYSTPQLATIASFLERARLMQEEHTARIAALADAPEKRPNRLRGGLSPAALRRVQLFVHAHLAAGLQLSDLAAHAGLSTYHFARAFKATTGTTPRAFVERARVERAARLMRETGTTLAEIATRCGFSTQSRLTIAFRKVHGTTPARYRRNR